MAYKADPSSATNQIVVDSVTSPTGDVQAMKILDGTAGSVTPAAVTVDGALQTTGEAVASAAVTSVAAATSSTQLAAANSSRRGLYLFNDSASETLYVKLGTGASTSSFTIALGPGDFWEMPTRPRYTGAVHGIWSAAVGNARVTEI